MKIKPLIVIFILFSAGCAKVPSAKYAWEIYRTPAATEDAFNKASVAILPAITNSSERIYREVLSGLLYNSIIKLDGGPHVLPPDIVQGIINKSEMLDDYQRLIKDYESAGVLRSDILIKLGRSLGARYIVLPTLLRFQQITFDRATLFGISFLRTRESSVDIQAQLWDTESSEMIWHGAGEGILTTEVVQGKPLSFLEVAQYACDSLASRLPWVKKSSNTPSPAN